MAGEVLLDVLLDELDTEIRVVHALDLVADAADCKRRNVNEGMAELKAFDTY